MHGIMSALPPFRNERNTTLIWRKILATCPGSFQHLWLSLSVREFIEFSDNLLPHAALFNLKQNLRTSSGKHRISKHKYQVSFLAFPSSFFFSQWTFDKKKYKEEFSCHCRDEKLWVGDELERKEQQKLINPITWLGFEKSLLILWKQGMEEHCYTHSLEPPRRFQALKWISNKIKNKSGNLC